MVQVIVEDSSDEEEVANHGDKIRHNVEAVSSVQPQKSLAVKVVRLHISLMVLVAVQNAIMAGSVLSVTLPLLLRP